MIAISNPPTVTTIEQLQEQLRKQLAALDEIGNAELNAFSALSAVLNAYRQADLSPEYFENFAGRILHCFPSEARVDISWEADMANQSLESAEEISELQQRIADLESDIDGLMAANKDLQSKNSDLEIDKTAAIASHAEIEKVLIKSRDGERVKELEKKIEELEAVLSRVESDDDSTKPEPKFKVGDRVALKSDPAKVGRIIKLDVPDSHAFVNFIGEDGLHPGAFSSWHKFGELINFSEDKIASSDFTTTKMYRFCVGDRVVIKSTPQKRGEIIELSVDGCEAFVDFDGSDNDIKWLSHTEIRLEFEIELTDEVTAEPEKKPSTELTYIDTEVAYLKLAANDQVLSGYIGFKNGTDANGKRLSSAKIRATKWMDEIQGLFGVSAEAIEIRSAERLSDFDYEIKISQKGYPKNLISLLNPLTNFNFSEPPVDQGVRKMPRTDDEQATPEKNPKNPPIDSFAFQPLEPFDEEAPQYTVIHSGQAIGKVFLSYAKKCWKISGDVKTEFISKESAAEELVKRSIMPETQISDAAF